MNESEDRQLREAIISTMELPPVTCNSKEELRTLLAARINDLIIHQFDKLVSLLYRIDISEYKLKQLLASNPSTDAGVVIANLIIERQVQKIKSREQFRNRENNISEEEKW
jgi:hypothetical protein